VWLHAGSLALSNLSILNGGYNGDMTLLGSGGTISMVGGMLIGNINVHGSLLNLVIKSNTAGGGFFGGGSNVNVSGLLSSGTISHHNTPTPDAVRH